MPSLVSRFVVWFRQNLHLPSVAEVLVAVLAIAATLGAIIGAGIFGFRAALHQDVAAAPAVVAVVCILLLAALARSGTVRLFGPVLGYDMVRIARRGRYVLLRFLYALVLLGALTSLYVYWSWNLPQGQRLSSQEITRFAESFFLTFMAAEFLVVLLLTPAYTAGAIAEEKDRGTLDFLLATDLRNAEVVLSKLVARLANLALIVLTGLPILSLTQFFGGIDPNMVLSGFAALGCTMASLACLSILHSTYARQPRDAIVFTYLSTAVYLGLSFVLGRWVADSPGAANWGWTSSAGDTVVSLGAVVDAFTAGNLFIGLQKLIVSWRAGQPLSAILPGLLRNYAIFHGTAAFICTGWAVARLRIVALKQASKSAPPPKLTRKWGLPALGAHPMLWKEVYAERGFHFNFAAKLVLGVLVLVSFAPAAQTIYEYTHELTSNRGHYQAWHREFGLAMSGWVQQVGTLVACLTLLGVAVRAAGSFSVERDKQTLDSLLLTPLRRDEILHGKWLGSVLSMRWSWIWLAAIWALGIATGGLHYLAVPLLMLAWLVFATFAANVGLYFSITSKTSLRAVIATFLALVGFSFGHWLVWMCMGPVFIYSSGNKSEFPDWVANFETYGMTPPMTLRILALHGSELQTPMYSGYRSMNVNWERFFCGLVGVICWGVASIGLGRIVSGRFRGSAGGEPVHPSEFAGGAHPLQPEMIPPMAQPVEPAVGGAIEMPNEHPPLAQPVESPASGAVLIEERRDDAPSPS
ncbi:MAG: ABC transporter permease subunit [Gemmataceae bacterium]|nr:ABC transporter permease subunit [Gemmataceae bacterium]